MPSKFFKIESTPLLPEGWGDYGFILQHGMAAHLPRVGGRLALERTGPYIPPITLPGIGDIVLTTAARQLLEASGLTGFGFLPVEKVLTVELRWESWDLTAKEPLQFPNSGEPEDYILGQPNSPGASAALGDLWEVSVRNTAAIERVHDELRLDSTTWNADDLIRGKGYGGTLFSQRARDWFCQNWGRYVDFAEFRAT